MSGVFVSYRWKDDPLGAAAVHESLARRFGPDLVFRDCVTMEPGDDYPGSLNAALERVDVLVCVIGPQWLTLTGPDGTRRIDDERDWVRRELVRALERDITIIPVLLRDTPNNATMPEADDLPSDIRGLARRKPHELSQRRLPTGLDELAERIVRLVPTLVIPQLFAGTTEQDTDDNAPSTLLRPEYRVVPFTGRTRELADLREWAAGPGAMATGLVTGAAGSGKTRLATELCRVLEAEGWLAGVVSGDAPAEQIRRTTDIDRPLLAVVDDVELRAHQLVALTEAVHDRAAARRAPARLLLTSRSPGDWSTRPGQHSDQGVIDLLSGISARSTVTLGPIGDQEAQYLAARRSFATRLGRAGAAEAAVPRSVLRLTSLLDVHAAALTSVLGGPAPGDPLECVALHDRKHWRTLVRAARAGHLRTDDMAAVCAVATLCAATSGEQAAAVLARLPDIVVVDDETVDEYVEWFRRLYPSRHPLGPVGPDPYGELLLARTLAAMPHLTTALATSCTDDQIRNAMTVLGRALSRHPVLGAATVDLLAADVDRLVPLGVDVAARLAEPEPFVRTMARAVKDAPPMGMLAVLGIMMRTGGPEHAHLGPLRAVMVRRYTTTMTGLFESMAPRNEPKDAPPGLQRIRGLGENLTDLIINAGQSLFDPEHPMPITGKDGRPLFPPEMRQLFDLWQRLPRDKRE